jgi:cytochrome oxidase Cu insertion factor (SCO1/SenC/PrrC family)
LFSPRLVAQFGLAAAFMVLALSVSALLIVPRRSRPIAPADVGMPAPDFRLSNANGQPVKLSDLRGQTVVLFFGSLHCPITAGYNERIDRLAHAYANDSRVTFLALDVPQPGEAAPDNVRVRVDARLVGRPFQTLLDSHGAVATRYSASETPFFVVIDPSGKVAYRGPFDDSQDIAFVTHRYLPDALQSVLGAPTRAVAQAIR